MLITGSLFWFIISVQEILHFYDLKYYFRRLNELENSMAKAATNFQKSVLIVGNNVELGQNLARENDSGKTSSTEGRMLFTGGGWT